MADHQGVIAPGARLRVSRKLPDGTNQMLGVVRVVIDPVNVDAEFAVIV